MEPTLGKSFKIGPVVLLSIFRMREFSLTDPAVDTGCSREDDIALYKAALCISW